MKLFVFFGCFILFLQLVINMIDLIAYLLTSTIWLTALYCLLRWYRVEKLNFELKEDNERLKGENKELERRLESCKRCNRNCLNDLDRFEREKRKLKKELRVENILKNHFLKELDKKI